MTLEKLDARSFDIENFRFSHSIKISVHSPLIVFLFNYQDDCSDFILHLEMKINTPLSGTARSCAKSFLIIQYYWLSSFLHYRVTVHYRQFGKQSRTEKNGQSASTKRQQPSACWSYFCAQFVIHCYPVQYPNLFPVFFLNMRN